MGTMAERIYRATMRIGDTILLGRLVFGFLVLCAIGVRASETKSGSFRHIVVFDL
jgi:hypothetical protein